MLPHPGAGGLARYSRQAAERYDGGEFQNRTEQLASIEAARLANTAARMMAAYQDGMLALDRIRRGGRQTVKVIHQHVAVGPGGQAVVAGSMKTGSKGAKRRGVEFGNDATTPCQATRMAQERQPARRPFKSPAVRRAHSIGTTLQRASDAERTLPDARRAIDWPSH